MDPLQPNPGSIRTPASRPDGRAFRWRLHCWRGPAPRAASADAPDDTAALFKTTCAICHEVPETKAPPTDTLRRLPASQHPDGDGVRQDAAAGGRAEAGAASAPRQVAGGRGRRQARRVDRREGLPERDAGAGDRARELGPRPQQHAPGRRRRASIAGTCGQLELLWSIALPAVTTMRSQPVVAGDTVFLGSKGAHLLALDRHSGCVRWSFKTDAPVHSALTLDTTPDGVEHAVLRRRNGHGVCRGRHQAARCAGASA